MWWCVSLCVALDLHAAEAPAVLHPEYKVGSWIWSATTEDKQTSRFWRAFEIPAGSVVIEAKLRLTADNAYRLFLNGDELGRGTEWKGLNEYDLTWVLKPGRHLLAVEAFNDYAEAGLVGALIVKLADGREVTVATDARWLVVPPNDARWLARSAPRADWVAATVKAPYLGGVWKSLPARITRVPPVRPVELKFWQTVWFQVGVIAACCAVGLWCLYLLSRLAVQAAAQEVLQRERARIARDIHDDFGARLTKLVLFGEVAQSELKGDSPLRARFEQVSTEGRNLLGALDEVIWTVNSRRDTVRDFEMHVCNYAEAFLRPTAIRLRLDVDPDLPEAGFELAIRRNLFLAVKEALNNAVRHAAPTEIQLGIHLRGEALIVSLQDNGRGFDPAIAQGARNGLVNMAQRTRELGGKCRVVSAPGAGCRVEFSAPLRHRRRTSWRFWRGAQPLETSTPVAS